MTPTMALESMEVEVNPTLAATLETTCASRPEAIARATSQAMDAVCGFIARHALVAAGPPRTIYTKYGKDSVTLTVAMPLSEPASASTDGDIKVETLPGAHALRFVHRGPYERLSETYGHIDRWLRDRGGIKTDADWAAYSPMWEEYLNDPSTTPPDELETRIYLTLRPPHGRSSST